MPNIWITSDTHFSHRNITKFETTRRKYGTFSESGELLSVDTAQMDADIIANHNSVVQPNDLVYILGDIAWNKQTAPSLINQLNGNKVLIRGNHDFDSKPFLSCFTKVVDYLDVKHFGERFVLFHYPIFEWDRMHYGSIHLHGHLHGGIHNIPGRIKDVYLGGNNLMPYNLEHLTEQLLQQPIRKHGILSSPTLPE